MNVAFLRREAEKVIVARSRARARRHELSITQALNESDNIDRGCLQRVARTLIYAVTASSLRQEAGD